ncbi:hypothetical protein EXIGLDRAFT_204092 [Exidia glandulosa HHB12029]|uniref:CCHC-type domain-containing protein n=1 Tax=Exidia glandulosa HHB12029 TaxID=1314781 RepID=A0A165ENK8_EXIGL|nr:hypothetical protein EXIGLDRAFT_204092 [Exidia glandulosa HHB12029]
MTRFALTVLSRSVRSASALPRSFNASVWVHRSFSSSCPAAQTEQNHDELERVVCFRCGQKGHLKTECPSRFARMLNASNATSVNEGAKSSASTPTPRHRRRHGTLAEDSRALYCKRCGHAAGACTEKPRCHRCGEAGHLSKNCPAQACFNCGKSIRYRAEYSTIRS